MLLATLPLLSAAPADAPLGQFRTWSPSARTPLTFTSGGVAISVAALPCPVPATGDTTCRWEGYNNQGAVTVSAAGAMPARVLTDPQSMYARVAAVRLDRRDPRPGVVVESQSGGSGGDMTAVVLVPDGNTFRAIPFAPAYGRLQGQLADAPRDLSGDGVTDFVLTDARFDSMFGCNACTPRPPVILAIKQGRLVEESRDPSLAGVYRRDMAVRRAECFSARPDRNGACAAYVADAARAGAFREAWAGMLRHYDPRSAERWPVRSGAPTRSFPDSLRAFLTATGYLPR